MEGELQATKDFFVQVMDYNSTDFFVTGIIETALLFVVLYGIAKYVFLEAMLRGKRAKIYYTVTFLVSIIARPFSDIVSQAITILALLIAMIIGRKKHKWIPIIWFIPWSGLADGIMLPLIYLPTRFMGDNEILIACYRAIAYGIIALALVLFIILGKNWRKKFEVEIDNRHLAMWERILLFVIGTMLAFFSSIISMPLDELFAGEVSMYVVGFLGVWLSVITFLLDLTVIITVMVTNKREYYHDKISDMQYNIIMMMADIVENRDENTGGHIQRTAKYVEIIAKQLKKEGKYKEILTDTYIKDMMVAAPLHDIGKIHVTDTILNKAGRLTDEEFQIMKTHAEEGRKLLIHAKEHLGDFSYLDIAVQMAGYHHEWWDGSAKGYPTGIKGEEIPLCARIMAVADVFDALTSKRCYKEPMPVFQAYDIIRKESGSHFDGEVVDAFFAADKQIEEALNYFMNEDDSAIEM